MYTSHSWRARELCSDFTVLDEWPVPVDVGRGEFPEFFRVFAANGARTGSTAANALFRIRAKLGEVFGWDGGPPLPIPGCTETTVAARLTDEDRSRDRTTRQPDAPFGIHVVYERADEALLEVANKTIHALLHLGWADGGVHLTVLTKSRGRMSDLYMKAIGPFRHAIVYPAWFQSIRAAWTARHAS